MMPLMCVARFITLCFILATFGGSKSHAQSIQNVTHIGRMDLELTLTNEKGKSDRLATQDGKISLSWDSRDCDLQTKDTHFPCKLDVSQDLLGPNGEIWIKALPKVHFDLKTLDRMLLSLGAQDRKSANVIYYTVKESAADRAAGYDVPWYAIREVATVAGEGPQFWNAFAGLYSELNVRAPVALGVSRSFTLRFHFHDLKAQHGAFEVTGNNGSGNFGQ